MAADKGGCDEMKKAPPAPLAPDHASTKAAVREVAAGIVAILQDAKDTSTPLRRSEWTVGEAAAHLAETQRLFAETVRTGIPSPYGDGSSTIKSFASVNLGQLTRFTERDGPTLAGLIDEETQNYLVATAPCSDDRRFRTHFGDMDVATMTSYMLVHLLMHGCPMAWALRRPPPIAPAHFELTIPFLAHVVPWIYNRDAGRGLRASLEVRIRRGPRFAIVFDDSVASVHEPAPTPADCYVSADPVAFCLVAYGVVPPWGAIGRGKMLAWGRKPWLALRLKTLIPNP